MNIFERQGVDYLGFYNYRSVLRILSLIFFKIPNIQ